MCRTTLLAKSWLGVLGALLAACAAESTAPLAPSGAVPEEIVLLGNLQVGAAGEALGERIGVRVLDSGGVALAGVEVVFEVTAGGGSVDVGRVLTDTLGEARTTWTLGTVARTSNSVVPTVSGFPGTAPLIQAVAEPGPVTRLEAVSGDGQPGMAGVELAMPLVLRALDRHGNAIRDPVVTWSTAGGNGFVVQDPRRTAGTGAVVWTPGTAIGVQRAVAVLPGGPADSLVFTANITPVVSAYDVALLFVTPVSAAQAAAFDSAAARWGRVIVGDLPAVTLSLNTADCSAGSVQLDQTVDDVLILVQVDSLDGPGGLVGTGFPCVTRSGGVLTTVGVAILDSADVASLDLLGSLRAAALQAVGLALGFGGAPWLAAAPPTVMDTGLFSYGYVGARGLAQLNTFQGWTLPYFYLDFPESGGNYFWWPAALVPGELMTAAAPASGSRLTALTIASFADLGYTVSYASADPFFAAGGAAGSNVPSSRRLVSRPPIGPRAKDAAVRSGIR